MVVGDFLITCNREWGRLVGCAGVQEERLEIVNWRIKKKLERIKYMRNKENSNVRGEKQKIWSFFYNLVKLCTLGCQ